VANGGENVHAHILFTRWSLLKNRTGFGKKKTAAWSKKPPCINSAKPGAITSTAAGDDARIDHRTLPAQGIDRLPAHLGRAAIALEQYGIETAKGNRWRDILHGNKARRHARPGLAQAATREAKELEMLSAAQARTPSLLALARQTYTGGR